MNRRKRGPRRAYLSKPAAHIVPSDTYDVAPLECPPAGVIARPITQERTIPKAQVVDECGIADLDVERRRELGGHYRPPRLRSRGPGLRILLGRSKSRILCWCMRIFKERRMKGRRDVLENTSFDDRAHDGVPHAGAVAPGGENGDFHGGVFCSVPVGTGLREVIYCRSDGRYGRKLLWAGESD